MSISVAWDYGERLMSNCQLSTTPWLCDVTSEPPDVKWESAPPRLQMLCRFSAI